MDELLTCAQMAEADRLTVAGGVSAQVLMENAGQAVAAEIRRRYAPCPAVVLCGPGNNGGDGFVVARHLARAGWPVRLGKLGDVERMTGEARHHAALWQGSVEKLAPALVAGAGLVVDAVFNRDYPVVQGVVLVTSCLFILLNLLADVLYVLINPRLRVA